MCFLAHGSGACFRLAGNVLVCIVIVWLTGLLELLSLLEAGER